MPRTARTHQTQTGKVTTARRKGLNRLRLVAAAALVAATWAAHALTIADLQPTAVAELKRAGLITHEVPVPAFRWTYANKRPMRRERSVHEDFDAGPEGLSSVLREIRYSDGKVEQSEAISARGLLRVSASDKSINASVDGLKLPPKTGEHFAIVLVRDNSPIIERCTVGDKTAAKTLFADLPGQLFNIECLGDATYAGLKVKAKSQVVYLEALGVFFNIVDVLDTPFGRYENANRITEFQLVTP